MVSIVKTLSSTDVGHSRTHQSGILIPKVDTILEFFPSLDLTKRNPSCLVALYSAQMQRFTDARYIFYNTKDLGLGTRSEYRLTRIAGLLRELNAQPGDDLVFTHTSADDIQVTLIEQDVPKMTGRVMLRNGWSISLRED
jgi:hypothetical protein